MTEQETGFVIIQECLLPFVRVSPVRFAVMLNDGSAGSMWKVEARGRGDVYIVPRDIMSGTKISLHASGQQHLKVDRPPLPPLRMNWKEPPLESRLPASFKIIFTAWSAGTGSTKDYGVQKIEKMWGIAKFSYRGRTARTALSRCVFFLLPTTLLSNCPRGRPWKASRSLLLVRVRTCI